MTVVPARIAIAAAVVYQAVAAALIPLRPDLDPSWQPISEWAIGPHGWIMSAAFLASALAYAALFVALRSQVRGRRGGLGLILVLLCAVGTAGVGLFTAEPITVPFDALSLRGILHVASGAVALLLLPVAALLVSLDLARHPDWSRSRPFMLAIAGLPLLALLAFGAAMGAIEPADHHVGPDVPIGWPSRAVLLVNSAWVIAIGWQALRAAAGRARP